LNDAIDESHGAFLLMSLTLQAPRTRGVSDLAEFHAAGNDEDTA
jgi:hypothetical protein